jgi:DNA primase
VVVAYDGDPPGLAAAYKSFPQLLQRGANVRHLALPAGHDPDSYLRESGPEALRAAIASAPPLLESLLGRIPASGAGDPTERAAKVRDAIDILTAAPDPVLRHELLSGLARGTGVPLRVLAPPGGKKSAVRTVEASPAGSGRPASLELPEQEARVLAALLSEWPKSAPLTARIPVDIFSHPAAKEIFTSLKAFSDEPASLDFSYLTSHLEGAAGPLAAELLLKEGNSRPETQGERGLGAIHIPLLQLKIRSLEEAAGSLQPEIQNAAGAGNVEERDAAYRKKQALVEEIRRLKSELKAETARRI